jgi:hypothetical protein
MTPKGVTVDGNTLRRFVDAVTELSERPTAVNVARYLRASSSLEQATSKAGKTRSRRSRAEIPA